MKLVNAKDPVLLTACQEFDFENPPFDIIEFSKEMVPFMLANGGIGLAGNQVGQPYRFFAMRGEPNIVCINPRIVDTSDEKVLLEEGCLTYHNLYVKIKRPRHIKVRFTVPNGEVKTETYTGITARVFQHELEHLDGGVFFKNASEYHRLKGLKDQHLMDRKEKRYQKTIAQVNAFKAALNKDAA